MRTRFGSALVRTSILLASVLLLATGCSAGPACVIDTDCPLGQFCNDQHCEVLGVGEDAGGGVDAGRVDSGGADAGAVDSGGTDSSTVDAGSPDAGPCTPTVGTFTLMSSPAACPTTAGTITVTTGASACEIVLSSREDPGFNGTVTGSGGSSYSGPITIGGVEQARCSVTFTDTTMTIDCGSGCTLPATLP